MGIRWVALAAWLAAASAGDWPAFRHDPQLTGMSPLTGAFASTPEVAWSVDLGAQPQPRERLRVEDVDGDGLGEILVIRDERIACLDRRGTPRWEAAGLPHARVTDVRDFAGGGPRGILAWSDNGLEATRWILSGATGEAVPLYRMSDVFGAEERIGKLLPGVEGEQVCAWWSGELPGRRFGSDMRGEGFLFSFENGVESPTTRFKQEMVGVLYKPRHFFVDYDRDGDTEMVMVSHQQAWFFDVARNALELEVHWPMIRTYWATMAMLPVQPDAAPSLLSINPHIPGVERVEIVDRAARVAWQYVAGGKADQYQTDVKVGPGAPDPYVYLAGDGRLYVLATVTNEHGDKKPWLVVLDGVDGRKLYEEPDARVLAWDDLAGDGKPELLVQRGEALCIADWQGESLVERWRQDGVEPLLMPLPAQGDLGRSGGGNTPVWRLAPGNPRFLLRFPEGVFACTLEPDGVHRGEPVTVHAALGNVPEANLLAETVEKSGDTVVVKAGGVEVYRREPERAVTYLAPPALAGGLGGACRVLVVHAGGNLLSLSAAGDDSRLLAPRVFGEASICDMDGDGRNEVVTGTSDEADRPSCVFIDPNGRVLRRFGLIENATALKVGPTGSLGPGKGRWLANYYERGVGNRNGVAVYDGRTGEQLWLRDDFQTGSAAYGPDSKVKFVLHLPTAVYDYDGDGADDLLAASENFYGVLSVVENRPLAPIQVFSDYIPGHWQAYACPIAADFLGKGQPQVFHHKAFTITVLTDLEGSPIWHWGLSRNATASTWPGIADLDADGTLEIVQARVDGLLRAFDARPLDEKCPVCPADAPLTEMNHAGHVRWEQAFAPPLSDLAAGDIDGDGKGEVLFGAGDGMLRALGEADGRPRVEWSYDAGRTVGSPVLADLDGDSRPEILAPVEDGRLVCLRAHP